MTARSPHLEATQRARRAARFSLHRADPSISAPGLTDAATKIELLSYVDLKTKHANAHLKLGLRRK